MKRYDFDDYARIPEDVSQAYARAAHRLREEPMRKRKLSAALVFILALALVTITAVAAVLLRGRDFVEQVMQPKAQEDDSIRWTQAEVEEILRIAEENGLELDDGMKQKLSAGGYYKEELMRIFMKLDLGQDPSAWSIEDQYWYAQMLMDIGLYDANYNALPEEGEATEAEMLAVARDYIHQHYDPEAPLTDEAVYRRHTLYQWLPEGEDEDTLVKQWTVWFEPLDLTHDTYSLTLDDQAVVLQARTTPGTLSQEASLKPVQLAYRFQELYGPYDTWEMATWMEFQPLLRAAAQAHDGYGGEVGLPLLAASAFALPEAGALTKAQAIEAAQAAVVAQEGIQASDLLPDKAYGVCLLDGETPVWKVTLPAAKEGHYIAEVDARTGEARNLSFLPYGSSNFARSYVLESVYQAEQPDAARQAGALRFDGRRYEAVEVLPDGGLLLVGGAWAGADTPSQAWAARVDAAGNTLWEVLDERGTTFEEAVRLSDGTLLLAMTPVEGGQFSFQLALLTLDAEDGRALSEPIALSIPGTPYKGKDCLLIAEFKEASGVSSSRWIAVNAQGETLWSQDYEELLGSGFHLHPAAEGYLLTGSAQGYPYDQASGIWGLVGRLDDQGRLLWHKRMEAEPQTGISESLLLADGGLYGAGMNFDKYEEGASREHSLSGFVARFDAAGDMLWCSYYPQLAQGVETSFFGLLPAPGDGVLAMTRNQETNEWFLAHLDGDGTLLGQWPLTLETADPLLWKTFADGEQGYIVYCSRDESVDISTGVQAPMNTYITPVVWPEA